jgi:hypothetical protein
MLIDVRDIDSSPHTILPIRSPWADTHPPPSLVEAIPSPSIRLAAGGSVAAGVPAAAPTPGAADELQHVHLLLGVVVEGVVRRVVVDRGGDGGGGDEEEYDDDDEYD